MKRSVLIALLLVVFAAGVVVAETASRLPKTYQVTGPVLELTDDVIVVQKGKDKRELTRERMPGA